MARGFQAETKKSRPFPSLEAEGFLSALRTADVLQGSAAEFLKPYGLSPTQYNALRILRGAGAQGLACSEVAERMINRDPDITRLLDRLQRRGLVRRSRERKDRRVVRAFITARGFELLQNLDRPVNELQRRLLGHLGQRRLRILIRLLETVRSKVRQPEAAFP
jgi:DNA-binding MarR family transcriptional regulator